MGQGFLNILSLEQVLRTIPSGLFLVDRDQRIVYWNAEAERITGYPAAEAVGRHCSFLAGIPCGRSCGLYNAAVVKPVIGVPCSVRTRDARRIILTKNVDYLRDKDGQIIGGVESFIEITRQKRLERGLRRHALELEHAVRRRTAELEAERSRLLTVLDAMNDLAYITSADYRVEFMNRAMVEVFGAHNGIHCYEVYGRQTACPWCPLPQVLLAETVREERFVEINGRTYEIMHTSLTDADGQIHKLSVFRDITERKEAEKKLRAANQELDAFVYTVSHDLRTPLTPIMGFAEFLKEEYGGRLDAQAIDMLEEIEKQGEKMLALLEDLLALARVGRIETPANAVDVTAVVKQVLEDLSETISRDGIAVTLNNLPPLKAPETLLAQLFSNLIGNALRYAGGTGARIEICGEPGDGRILYYVRDHGPGIPPEERSLIFDLFYRGSTAGKTIGTGIGLATVRKIVRLFDGRIRVEETPGGGSTFVVEFPSAAE
ncbi:MAG TPA: PAS domain-containing sensor histidine kinase [Desulfuromonadales bacterium]|nr:PAS domain-containing sensor histidine kinase [Desulfuromonadales bacterium]